MVSPRSASLDHPLSLFGMMWFGVVGSIVFLLLPLLIGAFTDELALDTRQVGWLGSADMTGMFIAAAVATAWIRKADWRRAGLVSAMALLACHLASAWIDHYWTLMAVRVTAGFAGGSMMSIALTALGDTRNPDRNFALFVSGQLGLGSLGLAVFPQLISSFGLAGAFGALAVTVALAIAVIPLLPRAGSMKAPESVAAVPRRHLLPGVAALLACFLFNLGIMMVWAYAERMGHAAGLDAGFIGNALAGSLMAALAGSLIAAGMAARFGRVLPLAITLALQVVALWLLAGERTQNGYLVSVMLFAFAWNFPVAFQLAITVSVDVTGRFVVLFLSAVKLGYAAAPVLAAWLLAGGGNFLPVLLAAAGVFVVSGMVFALLAIKKSGRTGL